MPYHRNTQQHLLIQFTSGLISKISSFIILTYSINSISINVIKAVQKDSVLNGKEASTHYRIYYTCKRFVQGFPIITQYLIRKALDYL